MLEIPYDGERPRPGDAERPKRVNVKQYRKTLEIPEALLQLKLRGGLGLPIKEGSDWALPPPHEPKEKWMTKGHEVEIFSESQQRWLRGKIYDVTDEYLTVRYVGYVQYLDYGKKKMKAGGMREEKYHRIRDRNFIRPVSKDTPFRIGEIFNVYREKQHRFGPISFMSKSDKLVNVRVKKVYDNWSRWASSNGIGYKVEYLDNNNHCCYNNEPKISHDDQVALLQDQEFNA